MSVSSPRPPGRITFIVGAMAFAATVAMPGVAVHGDSIDEALLAELKTLGAASWDRVTHAIDSSSFQVDGTETIYGGSIVPDTPPQIDRNWRFSLCVNPARGHYLIEKFESFQDIFCTTRFVANGRYAFDVGRPSEKPYALYATKKRETASDAPYLTTHLEHRWRLNPGCYAWYGIALRDLVAGKEFELKQVTMVGSDGLRRIRIAATCQSDAGECHKGGFYWAEVNPQHDWLVDSAGVDDPRRDVRYRVDVAYQMDVFDGYFPSRVVTTRGALDSENDPLFDRRTIEFGAPSECRYNDDEFYLPYYGIAEEALDSLSPSRSHRLRWSLVGIAGILLSIVLYRLAGRSTRKKMAMNRPQGLDGL